MTYGSRHCVKHEAGGHNRPSTAVCKSGRREGGTVGKKGVEGGRRPEIATMHHRTTRKVNGQRERERERERD